MKAVKFLGRGSVEVVDVPTPAAKGDVVVVQVTSSGICGTDLELLLPVARPHTTTPGHEVTGIVAEVDEARRFRVGDRVIVNCHVTCCRCEHCRAGDLIFCPDLKAIGFELDGGDAEYLAIPEASLRALPEDISEEIGVIIGDALGTPFHAAKKAEITPGQVVGVFGVGPLGQMAVLIAKSHGARVVAVDLNRDRLTAAEAFGADHLVNPAREDVLATIRRLTGGRGLDKALQCTPSAAAFTAALNALRLRGRMIQVGVCTKVEVNPLEQINNREIEIMGSRNFNDNELPELFDFVRRYPKVSDVITHRFPLGEAKAAFAAASRGQGCKILLKP
jgi:threonine dehydrogenase-like Zn-dependent dehydrogenase